MKTIYIFLIFICIIANCISVYENIPIVAPVVNTTEAHADTSAITPGPIDESMSLSENTAWVEAYADFLVQDNPRYFILLDVDFDGIPELFTYYSGYGTNMWISSIISYSEHGIEQFKKGLLEEIPAQFELYKDKQTGEIRWMMVMDTFRSGYSRYIFGWDWIDFGDYSDIKTEFFFRWDFEGVETDDEMDGIEVVYYLYKNTDEMMEVEYEEIEKREQALFSRYERIETQQLYAYMGNYVINEDMDATVENLDRKLIVDFLLQWN